MATHITIPMARLIELETAEHERDILRTENAKLAREARTWWTALAGATAEIEQWRRSAERCVTAWTVVRGGVWDPNGLMDEHMAALRKALGPRAQDRPSTPVGWSDTDWLKHLEEIQQNEAAYHRGPLPERGWD